MKKQVVILIILILVLIVGFWAEQKGWLSSGSKKQEQQQDPKSCQSDSDCLVFGQSGDCNCGCFNNGFQWTKQGDCFCALPKSCKCVDSKCQAVFEQVSNFKECLAAGYQVMENEPRQCKTPEGTIFTEEKEQVIGCVSNDDCVAAICCHPKECVLKSQIPDCSNIMCTQECLAGTMDCGQGSCVCIEGKCQVKWQQEEKCNGMTIEQAREIAKASECGERLIGGTQFCNNSTKTWWINLDIEKPGCSPACVIDTITHQAEINWRCTGLIVP